MTKKKDMTEEKLLKAKADNAVVYKVMVALLLLCGSLTVLRSLRRYYSTLGGFEALYPLTIWIAAAGLALFFVSAVVMLAVKQKYVRMVMPWINISD